jgi:hypothetical protein
VARILLFPGGEGCTLYTHTQRRHPERRKKRSGNLFLALRYWLTATAERTGVAGLALTDRRGMLLASSLSRAHAEELASLLPVLVRSEPGAGPFNLPMSIREVPLLGGRLLLCAVGDASLRELGLDEAAVGVQRIMGELAGSWPQFLR